MCLMFWVFRCLLPYVLRTPCSVGGKWHACLAWRAVCNSQQAKCGTHQAKSGTEKPLRIGVRHQNYVKPSLYRDYDFLEFFVRICLATQRSERRPFYASNSSLDHRLSSPGLYCEIRVLPRRRPSPAKLAFPPQGDSQSVDCRF